MLIARNMFLILVVANTCGSTVSKKVSYIESPNYPSAAPTGMCMYSLPKCDAGICSYK